MHMLMVMILMMRASFVFLYFGIIVAQRGSSDIGGAMIYDVKDIFFVMDVQGIFFGIVDS